MSKFMRGTSLLAGDNTSPGLRIPKELEVLIPVIFRECQNFGLDCYDTVVQMLTHSEMSEIVSYNGFPVRFPHWSFGMEYEEFVNGYEKGLHRVFELVVNTQPCYIYCMDSNTLVDNVTVIAHAMGHNDFFKNNIYFSKTSGNMMNELANNGRRIRSYMKRWGTEKVIEFVDHVLRIQTLIDPGVAWHNKISRDATIQDERKYKFPIRIQVDPEREYMENYINPKDWIERQKKRIHDDEVMEELGFFTEPTKDIMGFIRDQAALKPWQQDIIGMLHEEALYFYPQGETKMLNEGWASFVDSSIMARRGLVGLGQATHDAGIVDYAKHKANVLGGKYSQNPYKLGYMLFMDIEERWNKGRFGTEYEECQDINKKEHWDMKLGLGHQKIFEVRKHYNDVLALLEFFTPEFCHKNEFYEYAMLPNGEYKLLSRDYKKIKDKLIKRYLNRGLPEIRLVDPNHRGRGEMLLEHIPDGRGALYEKFLVPVLNSLSRLWQHPVVLTTKDENGEEFVYMANGGKEEDVSKYTYSEYIKHMGGKLK